jgi:hypothetical protein
MGTAPGSGLPPRRHTVGWNKTPVYPEGTMPLYMDVHTINGGVSADDVFQVQEGS